VLVVLPNPLRGMGVWRNSKETQQSGHALKFAPSPKDVWNELIIVDVYSFKSTQEHQLTMELHYDLGRVCLATQTQNVSLSGYKEQLSTFFLVFEG